MLTVFFRSLTAATATAIAIVAPIRIISSFGLINVERGSAEASPIVGSILRLINILARLTSSIKYLFGDNDSWHSAKK